VQYAPFLPFPHADFFPSLLWPINYLSVRQQSHFFEAAPNIIRRSIIVAGVAANYLLLAGYI
jgi:hypothetical protein